MTEALIHDLRHWLTAILGALDGALETGSRDDILLARRAAEQAVGLLGDPKPEVLLLNGVLREMAPLLSSPGIRTQLVLAPLAVSVRADPAALGRVLINLAANARETMPDGGTLTLRGGQDGAYATVAIEDTGPGIPSDVLARMFEPGFTTRETVGGGLGLAIVRDIVMQAGGFVTAESVVGQGTTVMVHWPVCPSLRSGKLPGKAKAVLLVEDEPIARHLAERALTDAGWHVIPAESAEAALVAVRRSTPDAMVADVTLPGMDGRALTAMLRARWPKLPAVLVSGYADSAGSADPTGENTAFLAKPYTLAALVAAARTVIRD